MPKYLISGHYTAEGIRGLRKDKASGREKAVATACEALGGKLESFHYALGDDDLFAIVDLPDAIQLTAICLAVSGSGMFRTKSVPLLTVAEMDAALGAQSKYRPPGG